MSEYRDAIAKISDDLQKFPVLWEKDTFDNFEIGTCEILRDEEGNETGVVEQHYDPDRPIDMYTVYGHYPNDIVDGRRGVDALFDFDTLDEAESVKAELEVLTFGGAK